MQAPVSVQVRPPPKAASGCGSCCGYDPALDSNPHMQALARPARRTARAQRDRQADARMRAPTRAPPVSCSKWSVAPSVGAEVMIELPPGSSAADG